MRYKIRVTLKDNVISLKRTIDNSEVELDPKYVRSGELLNAKILIIGNGNSTVLIPVENIAYIELIPYPQASQ